MRVKVRINSSGSLPAAMGRAASKAEVLLTLQIAKDTEPYVPALTGAFSRNARVVRNCIIYQGEQVNYLWEGVKMANAATGRGPRYIPDVGYRWPKGATLVQTSDPLTYTKDMHAKAGDHWIDRAEREKGKQWAEIAGRLVLNGLNR